MIAFRRLPARRAPQAAPLHRRAAGEAGFTLIEVLIALAIVAFASAMVMMNGPAATPSLGKEADRLAARVIAARDHALVANRPVALAFSEDGYERLVSSREGWGPPDGRRDVTPWIAGTSVSVPGERLPFMLTFDSTGLTADAAIDLFRNGRSTRLAIDGAGNVRREAAP